ncbi:MAG TPA: ABC transporter ATP-binding protein [Chthoniobacterales bacterium]|nr:ABC transporter ATP-binding protein [Chthoniobacterales bacterium]
MAELDLIDIEKHFGANWVIRKLNLRINQGEFVVLLGPSGCGKTTTLRAIAGLETIDSGEIRIDGKPVESLPASDRDIAFVFQLYSLYPHMTAFENIAFPLRAFRMSDKEVREKVKSIAKVLRIEHLLQKKPSALAGGDMQRVTIGRALVRRPKAILMDEPIGALDAKLREEMRVELRRLHIENQSTTVYVTHDQVEAMSMADRIAIMNDGVLQQVGSPMEVYSSPANLFVAQFVGSPIMNVVNCRVESSDSTTKVRLDGMESSFQFGGEVYQRVAAAEHDDIALGVRPEAVLVERTEQPGYSPGEIHLIEPLGAYDILDIALGKTVIRARTESRFVTRLHEPVWVQLDETRTHFFDRKSGLVLNRER